MNERVFISYSSEDMQWASAIKENLDANGISCWMANNGGISPGEDYVEEIMKALDNCEVFVLVLSENAEKSAWVVKELGTAITARKKIIPVKITDYQIKKFRFQLENIQVFEPGNLAEMADQISLVNAVKKALDLRAVDEKSFVSRPMPEKEGPAVRQAPERKNESSKNGASSGLNKRILVPAGLGVLAAIVLILAFMLGKGFSNGNKEQRNAAEISEADTSGTDISGADTFGADISGADTSGTDTSGANTSEGQENGGWTFDEILNASLEAEQKDAGFCFEGDYKEFGTSSEDGRPVSWTFYVPAEGWYFFEMRFAGYACADQFLFASDFSFLKDASALPADSFGQVSAYLCAVTYLYPGEYSLTTNSVRCHPKLDAVTVIDASWHSFDYGKVYVCFSEDAASWTVDTDPESNGMLYFYGGPADTFLQGLSPVWNEAGDAYTVSLPANTAGLMVLDYRYA